MLDMLCNITFSRYSASITQDAVGGQTRVWRLQNTFRGFVYSGTPRLTPQAGGRYGEYTMFTVISRVSPNAKVGDIIKYTQSDGSVMTILVEAQRAMNSQQVPGNTSYATECRRIEPPKEAML